MFTTEQRKTKARLECAKHVTVPASHHSAALSTALDITSHKHTTSISRISTKYIADGEKERFMSEV